MFSERLKSARRIQSQQKGMDATEIFNEYMKKLDEQFITQNRNVLFVADNCPSHSKHLQSELRAIKLIFSPPNMTLVVQPMDAAVIKNLNTI